MEPMQTLRLALGELLADDVATLAPVAANEIVLFKANFALTEDLVIGDLVLADFAGYAAKGGVAATQQVGTDPLTGDQVITILAPVGGWRWEATAAPDPVQTIYGYGLTDSTGADLLAAALLPQPLPISDIGNFIDLGQVTLRFVRTPMS